MRRLLRARPRSTAEVVAYLRRKGFSDEAVATTLGWAQETGLLDDALFARLWVEDRLARRPCAARLLRFELARKGIAEELIEAALADVAPGEGERLRRLIAARLPRYRGQPPEVRRRKLLSFLRRRGFTAEEAFAALEELEATEI